MRWSRRDLSRRTQHHDLPSPFYHSVLSPHDIDFYHGVGDLTGCTSPPSDADRAGLTRQEYLAAQAFLSNQRRAARTSTSTDILNDIHLPAGMLPEHWAPAIDWLLSPTGTYRGRAGVTFDPNVLVTGNWHTTELIPGPLHQDWKRVGVAVLDLGLQYQDKGNALAADTFVGLFHALYASGSQSPSFAAWPPTDSSHRWPSPVVHSGRLAEALP